MIKVFSEHKNLATFVIVNYIDKFLVFLLPMLVLYITKSKDIYNTIEYVYSIANIIVPFFGFISSYAFYGYKISQKEGDLNYINSYKAFQTIMLVFLFMVGIVVSLLIPLFSLNIGLVFLLLIYVRFLYLLTVNNNNVYYRLIDQPVRFLIYTIICSISSAILVFFFSSINSNRIYTYACFFLPQFALVSKYGFEVFQDRLKIKIREVYKFVIRSINFAWPTVINCTIVAFVMNYGKIYAYNFLSSYEMYNFSYTMRISMIIQMAHSSLIAYYAKELYVKGYSSSFYKIYVMVIGFAFLLSVLFVYLFNQLTTVDKLAIDSTTYLIFLYTFIHCCGASLELFFGRSNMNKKVLIMSVISCLFFCLFVFVLKIHNLKELAFYMVLYSLIYFFLMLYGAFHNKLFMKEYKLE